MILPWGLIEKIRKPNNQRWQTIQVVNDPKLESVFFIANVIRINYG